MPREKTWNKLGDIYPNKPFVSCRLFIENLGEEYGWNVVLGLVEKYEAYLRSKTFLTRKHFENMLRIIFTKEARAIRENERRGSEAAQIKPLTYKPPSNPKRKVDYDIF